MKMIDSRLAKKYFIFCFVFCLFAFLNAKPPFLDTPEAYFDDFTHSLNASSAFEKKDFVSKGIPFDPSFSSININTQPVDKKPFCFPIEAITFTPLNIEKRDPEKLLKKFSFVYKLSKPYQGTCIGSKQINELLKKLNAKAIQKGYITTKFGLLPQDLNQHILKIGIEVGFISEITYNNGGKMFFFSKDFGIKKGDVLDLKSIELGIANLKRMRYLSSTSKILPTKKKSQSEVVITSERKSLPFFIQASFDNGGSVKEGYEGTFLLGIENPLYLADSLQVYLLGSIPFSKKDHSYYGSLSYSLPIRRVLFRMDFSYAHSASELLFYGISPIYSGNSINTDLKVNYLAYSDVKNQLSFGLGFSGRFADNYLEQVKLDVQSRKITELSAFIDYKRYVSNSQFNIVLGVLQGVPMFGSNKSIDKTTSYTYTIPNINLYIYHPFYFLKSLFVYNSSIKTQISRDQLYASEKMSIGGRYSVRGFNHFSLNGQMGILYRNDLMMYLPSFWGMTFAPSIAADVGYVADLIKDTENTGFLSGGGIGLQLFSKYFNAQVWGYLPFYNPYNAPTQNLFFSVGVNW